MRKFFRWLGVFQGTGRSARQSSPKFVRDEDAVYPKLYDANLEDRRVLNADPLLVGAEALLHIDARGGAGDGQPDQFQIRRESTAAGEKIVVDVNSVRVWAGSASSIKGIVLHGSSDQDIFYVDPTITMQSGIVIQGGGNNAPSANASQVHDIVLFGSATDRLRGSSFESTSDGINIRVQHDANVSRFQLVGIELIADLTQSASRDFRIDGPTTWTLSDANVSNLELIDRAKLDLFSATGQRDSMLQLGSSNTQFVFGGGMERLQISAIDDPLASPLRLDNRDAHLNQIDNVAFALKSSDVIAFQGNVQLPQQLEATAGAIDLRGSLEGISSTVNLQADLSIRLDRWASLSSHGGPVTFSASNITIDGSIQVGGQGSIELSAGREGLLIVTGKLFAAGDTSLGGGRIDLRGGEIQILDGAEIDASGSGRAGSISIGGGFRGLPGAQPNSHEVFIDSHARIRADGIERGEGGKIAVWSENKTTIRGTHVLTARGGDLSGNGGVIETSSRGKLIIDDPVSLASANGLGGTWIIDPKNIHVVADSSSSADDLANSYIKVSVILNQLNAGTNVILDTSGTGTGAGDIFVTTNINATAATAAKLVFIADRNFVMSAGVSISGPIANTLGVEITAGNNIDASQGSFSNLKYLSAVAVGTVNVSAITANGTGDTNGNAIHLKGNSIVATGAINAAGGDVLFTSTGTLPSVQLSGSGNITTTGGDVSFVGGGKVLFDGTRTISTSGGNVTITDVASIDSTVSASTIQISTTATSGGNVALASIPNLAGNIKSLVIDTHGTTGTGGNLQLGDLNLSGANSTLSIDLDGVNDVNDGIITLNNQTASDTAITFAGDLDLSDYVVNLADNAQLTVNGGNLTLGNIQNATSSPNANLSLASQGDISLDGTVNIGSGNLSLQIDTDNNSASDLTTAAAINAGSISITGSAARNDTATIDGAMTTQGSGITFSTLDTVTLNANLNSGSTLTFTNIKTDIAISGLATAGARLISANGTIDFTGAPTILQTGANNTFVTIATTGTGSSINFSGISSVNSPTLSINSKAGVAATGAIDLNNGTFTVNFGKDNTGTANAVFSGSIDAGTISVTGGSLTGDNTSFNNDVTAITGDVITASTNVALKANIQTNGGKIQMSGGKLFVDGTTTRTLQTGGEVANAGNVDLSGMTEIDGITSAATFIINAIGTTLGGNVSLGNVVANLVGINRIDINNFVVGGTDGSVTIKNIRLVANGTTPAQLNVNVGKNSPSTISAEGIIDLSESVQGKQAGTVNFGQAFVVPTNPTSTLTILTNHKNTTVGNDNSNGGNIILGRIGNSSGDQFDSVTLDASAADTLDDAGRIDLSLASSPSIVADGPAAAQNTVNILMAGDVRLPTDGSGLTVQTLMNTNRTGAINLSRASLIGNGNLNITTTGGGGATASGHVYLGDVNLTSAPSQLSIATQAATLANSGIVFLDDGDGTQSTTSIRVLGSVNLSNSILELNDNTLIEVLGEGNTLSVGTVNQTTGATNVSLSLRSEDNVTVAGPINLNINSANAIVDIQIDSNNNSSSALTVSGIINAGNISLKGSAANNDTATINSALGAGTGGITIANFQSMKINQNLSSQSSITVSQIATEIELVGGTSITAAATISMSNNVPLVRLTGLPNTTVTFDVQGNGSVDLPNVTSPTGIGLTIGANNSVKTGTINIGSGDLQINFSRVANAAASADFQAISAGAVSVNGANRITDSILLRDTVTTTKPAGSSFTNGGNITVFADLLTQGGALTVSGRQLVFDGTLVHNLNTNINGVTKGGNIDLSGVTSIDAKPGVTSLTLNTQGTSDGGSVSLASIVATQGGLNRLVISTAGNGGLDGQVTLRDVRLLNKQGTQSRLDVNSADLTPSTVFVQGLIDLSESGPGVPGGVVDFGDGLLAPITGSGRLTITVASTNNQPGIDGSNGGSVRFGGTTNNGTSVYDFVSIDTSAADPAEQQGTLSFGSNTAKTIAVDGTPTNQNAVGLQVIGQVVLPQANILTLQSLPGTNGNSQAIDLSRAKFVGNGTLKLDTSSNGTSGNVFLGDVNLTSGASSLIVSTQGTTAFGMLELNDADGATTATEIQVLGAIDLSQTRVRLLDNALIRTFGDNGFLQIGRVDTDIQRLLTLTSSSDLALGGPIDLQGGALALTVDQDDNQLSNLIINGTINVGSLTIVSSPTNLDQLTINQNVTTTLGAINITQFDSVVVGAKLQSNTDFSISNVSNKISLGTLSQILAKGVIQLNNNVNRIEMSGAVNSTSIIDTTGPTASIALAPIFDIGNAVDLNIGSDGGITFSPINASQTNVVVQFSRNPNVTNQAISLGASTARGISIQGGNKPTDLITLQGVQQLGTSGLTLSNVGNSVWNANIISGGVTTVTNISGKVQIAEGVSVDGTGGVGIATGVSVIEFLGNAGSSSRIKSVGDGGNINLAAIQATNGVNLSIVSDNNVVINSIQNGMSGSLDIQVDANNNSVASASLTSGAIQSGSIRAQGSAARDDIVTLNGTWTSTKNDIQLFNWKDVNINNGLQSAGGISISDISNAVSLNSTAAIIANAGNVAMQNGVNRINLTTNGDHTITALQGSVSAAAMVGNGTITNLQINADQNIQLHSTSNIGNLQLRSGRNNSPVGSINASNTLQANTIQLDAATGIGTANSLATATSSIQATNRLDGKIDISNTSANQTILDLTNLGNSIIQLAQAGGGALSITNAKTQAVGAPVLDGVNITITNTGGNIQVEGLGTGIEAGALGSIRLQTLNSGDVKIDKALSALSGQIIVQSAGLISGTGVSTANAVILDASTGIGATQALKTNTTVLNANTAAGNINLSNTSATTATVDLRTMSNGGINFVHNGSAAIVKQASALGIGAGSIDITSANGNLTIQGPIINGGTSTTSGIVLTSGQNIVLASGTLIQTQAADTNTKIAIHAGGQFILQPGAVIRAGVSDPTTEARLSKLPIPLAVFPVFNVAGVNVDAEGNTEVLFRIGSAGSLNFDKNFLVTIVWGDGNSSVLPNTQLVPLNTINSDGTLFSLKHKYLLNPNPDPTAPILISVTAKVDALNRIQVFENQIPSTQLQVTENINLLVPASGLFAFALELAQAPEVIRVVVAPTLFIDPVQSLELTTTKPIDFVSAASETVAKKERTYTIRIVTPKDDYGAVEMSEPVSITEDELNDLATLFSKLGDNRYRIFVTYENGIEVLLRDFYLRNGIPAEIDDSVGREVPNQDSNDQGKATDPEAKLLFQPANQHQDVPREAQGHAWLDPIVAESSRRNTEDSAIDREASELPTVGNNLLHTVSAALGWRSLKKAARRFRSAG